MNKKITGFILSAIMILVLLPAFPAKADGGHLDIGDIRIDLTRSSSYMDGQVEYDASTHTLTLNGLEYITNTTCIDAEWLDFDLTIKGSAKLTSFRTHALLIYDCNLILDGDFEFYADRQDTIVVVGTLTVNGGSLYTTNTGDYSALSVQNLILNKNETFVVGDIDAKEILIAQAGLVTFVNDDKGHTELQSGNVKFGETPKYEGETPSKEADVQYTYTAFSGWTDGTTTYGKDETLPAVDGDVTYTAVFDKTVNKYDLTFDLGGGTLNGKTGTYTMTCEYGAKINLPDAPTKEGYTFLYWKGSEYEAGAEYTVKGRHDFTAVWEGQETSPKTGDSNQIMLWIALLTAALAGGLGVLIVSLKRKQQ